LEAFFVPFEGAFFLQIFGVAEAKFVVFGVGEHDEGDEQAEDVEEEESPHDGKLG
jgi:hypothetical protein